MNPEKPVVLIHACGLDHQDWDRPDRQGRLYVLAAAELYRQGKVSKIFFAGGEYRRGEVAMATTMVEQLKRDLRSFPEEDVIVAPEAVTTRAEIKIFKEIAAANGWNNLLDVSSSAHLKRIERRLKKVFPFPVPTSSVESILIDADNERYIKFLDELKGTNYSKGEIVREAVLAWLDALPLVGDLVDFLAHLIPSKCYLEVRVTELLGSR